MAGLVGDLSKDEALFWLQKHNERLSRNISRAKNPPEPCCLSDGECDKGSCYRDAVNRLIKSEMARIAELEAIIAR